ncbi:hypothetical protein FACS189468_0750 [Spirochaetia bacterium]|nr:hypothetical protein FACS189468_0750 [Spirochaetia bacterium]
MTASEVSGYLLLNKQAGLTSFESLGMIKKAFSTGKVCHTGTLDKFASGLLIILVGRAVKLSSWFSGCDKRYRGTIRLGIETDTLDPEGQIIAEAPLPSRETLEGVLPQFRGEILQAPPVYSAIHVQGERAHKLARSGAEVEMEKRPVTTYALKITAWEPPLASIEVHCSKGTYIRSLARDMALAAGSRGHLVSLTRTRVAGFRLEEASEPVPEGLTGALRPIDTRAFEALGLPWVTVDEERACKIIQGKALSQALGAKAPEFPDTPDSLSIGIFRENGEFVGIIEKKADGSLSYGYVYAGH